ncbi:flagellar basal body P-ring protein [Phycisphaerae bacterium RAS1]|nr:flagellar basal body P-ring protein [Phycisphaerae bacterium RAS1]
MVLGRLGGHFYPNPPRQAAGRHPRPKARRARTIGNPPLGAAGSEILPAPRVLQNNLATSNARPNHMFLPRKPRVWLYSAHLEEFDMRRPARLRRCVRCGAMLLLLAGCSDGTFDFGRKPADPPSPPAPRPITQDPILADTIAAQALMTSATGLRVRGFGLVEGLGTNGSGDCPPTIREYLVEFMSKEYSPTGPGSHKHNFSPDKLIDSPDTAVVEVTAVIPAGAPRGTIVDLQVQAIPGTSTRSLEGGLLLPCELRIFDASASGKGMLAGRVMARANGPIFVNPFAGASESRTGTSDPRRGFVLGGGRSIAEREVQLQLVEPSYAMARRIQDRINARFGAVPRTADATSKGFVTLHTPAVYMRRPERFLQLVTHVYLPDGDAYRDRALLNLSQRLAEPDARYDDISLAFEAIGKTAIPSLQRLYTHESEPVSFYATRAGLRLGDAVALGVMSEIALAPQHPQRLPAVRELAACNFPQAGIKLAPLLESDDQELRIAAYEALVELRHPAVHTTPFRSLLDQNQVNVVLDVVQSSGRPLIYVRRSRVPRIAVFGDATPVATPVFYSHPDDEVTLVSEEGATDLTVFARGRKSRQLSEKLRVSPRVVDLISAMADVPLKNEAGHTRGLGLPYARVVQVLKTLTDDGSIPARLLLEQPTLVELLGPTPEVDRPEAGERREAEAGADRPDKPTSRPTEAAARRE